MSNTLRKAALAALLLFLLIEFQQTNAAAQHNCADDDEDCREQFMHPDMSERDLRRRSLLQELTTEYWLDQGERFVAYKEATANAPIRGKAKNIIFFLGDGMSLTTLAATRIYMGGEERQLSFETFSDTGLVKTYAVDRLVPDSASTATAFLCGVKTNFGTLGLTASVQRGDCLATKNSSYHVDSIAKWALDSDRQVGLVTNTRVTHATPAALYAHSAERDWENDKKVKNECGKLSGVQDIALQLMQGYVGSRLKVIMGGGKAQFLDKEFYEEGKRRDGRNLIQDFLNENKANVYAETKQEMLQANASTTKRLLGLFNDGHMSYHLKAKAKQPSLLEMTQKAMELLSVNNYNGYLLFIESGRIDLAHHNNKAKLALDETARLSEAVEWARANTNPEETLIVVSSDHSHTMSISGYATRKNDIFGEAAVALDGLPYMTLSYANGPSFAQFYDSKKQRLPPTKVIQASISNNAKAGDDDDDDDNEEANTTNDITFPATAPMSSETHGGEDVPVFASGPWAELFSGVYEQSTLPYLMAFAGNFGPSQHLREN